LGNRAAWTTRWTCWAGRSRCITTARTANSQNEQTSVGSATLAFHNAGDTTTDEQGRRPG
jgi:hypothetical protein